MTRINCIPVSELVNKHLVAEYRELPRVLKLARHRKNNEVFPSEYTLGIGHVKFFYDKLGYICNRFSELVCEMQKRGFKTSFTSLPKDVISTIPQDLFGEWSPTPEAMVVNRKRIQDRLVKI